MIRMYPFVLIIFGLIQYSYSLQSGFTCKPSVTLSCPIGTKILILEATYSSECPNLDEENNDGIVIYAPSRCVGYNRERASNLCNGKQICTIDNNIDQQIMFSDRENANCNFKSQSVNVDYSCMPEFYSSKLPRIDICSLQSLHDVKEGFIHTPNYPNGYPNGQTCSKTVPSPDVGHRLKIYALDFDIEGLSALRFFGIKKVNDWFQINNSGERMYGTRSTYTSLFDDVIEASLMFKSDFANSKRPYKGFLLYFIITPIRGTRPSTISTEKPTTTPTIVSTSDSNIVAVLANDPMSLSQSKSAALVGNDHQQNNVGLTLLVVLLSGILFVIICGFLLYKRRNDRRVRYLTDMFNSFFPSRTRNVTLNTTDNGDETTLNNTVQSKLDVSTTQNDEKFTKMSDYDVKFTETPKLKHVNINEIRENQEKQIFIENLKTCPSPYSSYRRSESKFNSKEQTNLNLNSNIYSQEPLTQSQVSQINNTDNNSLLYEYVDLNPQEQQKTEEEEEKATNEDIVYDVINSNIERPVQQEIEYDSILYAIPKNA